MTRRALALATLAAWGTLPACATSRPAPQAAPPAAAPAQPAARRELAPRADLPLAVRETLSASMERHGEQLSFLLVSVVLLDYEAAEQLAQLIATEPKLGRPQPQETETLNALLPEAFFVQQDRLTERARGLALAARDEDDARLVKAFGALAETCVDCHASYLHAPLEL